MSEKERLQIENELLMTCSKAQAINKYIDELEESSKLSGLWCKSQQENKQLQERIEYLERSNNRREDTILEQRQKIGDLEDNWIKLKEIAKSRSGLKKQCYNGGLWFEIDELLETMQELEGSNNQ